MPQIIPYGFSFDENRYDIRNRFDNFNENDVKRLNKYYSYPDSNEECGQSTYSYAESGFFNSTEHKDFRYFIAYLLIGDLDKAKDQIKTYSQKSIGEILNSIFYSSSEDANNGSITHYNILDFLFCEYTTNDRERVNFNEIIRLLVGYGVKLNITLLEEELTVSNIAVFISKLTRSFPDNVTSDNKAESPFVKEAEIEPVETAENLFNDKMEIPSDDKAKVSSNDGTESTSDIKINIPSNRKPEEINTKTVTLPYNSPIQK